MAAGRCYKRRDSSCSLRVDGCGSDLEPRRRRRRPGIRVNSKGVLYVLDSEDEDSEMEVEEDGRVATLEVVEGAPCVVLDGVARVVVEAAPGVKATTGGADGRNVSVEGAMVVANNETAGNDLSVKGSSVLASKVEADPDVPEALKEVLAHMDPIYHGVFVSMYKILNLDSWVDILLGHQSGAIPLGHAHVDNLELQ